ncbi:hypothetical protein [Bifidobacterium tibiigranuli]|jgi:hypothetical protein|uniref:hypothetical protein n=1 Tax=Bifidobacterium tibiigranuli TaxID=2172043 RepID=UPI0026ECADFE|nr:hypothetical protein [Bifidobacterium tibiigranuli]MCI1713369.1 hypothetical protein [Bifidobacterium tibiigranuli]
MDNGKNSGIRGRLRALQDRHPALAGLLYTLAALLLLGLLLASGIIPGLYGGQPAPSPSPAGASAGATAQAPASHNPALDGGDWRNASAIKARDLMQKMSDELDTTLPIDGKPLLRDYLAPVERIDPHGDYADAENDLTDLAKRIIARPASDQQGVSRECDQLDAAWQTWQAEAWNWANKLLNEQVIAKNVSERAAREFIRNHPQWPYSCRVWASHETEGSLGKPMARQDFFYMANRIKTADSELNQCIGDMTPDQSGQMPQDQVSNDGPLPDISVKP